MRYSKVSSESKADVRPPKATATTPPSEKEDPALPNAATPSPVVSGSDMIYPSPSDDKKSLGDIPQAVYNLGKAMKQEVLETTASCKSRQSSVSCDLSSDEDEFDLMPSVGADNIITTNNSPRIGSRNEIYGYQYACPYIVTAHMGKNGPHSDEKIYDKEFLTHLFESIKQRNELGAEGFKDMTLLCNRLDIHSVKIMRNQRDNRGKQFRYSNGGIGFFHIYVRVFTKKQVKDGLNNEAEILKWLEKIREAFCATRAQYTLRLSIGGLLGKHRANTRALDNFLLDGDVAEYAKMIYAKKFKAGTMLTELRKVNQFFSPWNEEAARDLLS